MAVVFPYVKNTTWADNQAGGTPVTAAKLNIYEDGIFNAHQQPAVRVFHNTTQSIPNITDTAVLFNSERFDQAGGAASTQHDTVTNNSRLTCLYAGVYLINAHLGFASNTTGTRYCFIRLNGATIIGYGLTAAASVDGRGNIAVTTMYTLAVNDYVELLVNQSSGGALNTASTANYSPEFMWVRVG